MTELALDETIAQYLFRYADFEFDFTYKEVPAKSGTVSKPDFGVSKDNMRQNIFIRACSGGSASGCSMIGMVSG